MALIPTRFVAFFSIPVLHRAAYHFRRITGGLDGSFYRRVGIISSSSWCFAAVVTVTETGRARVGHRSGVLRPVPAVRALVGDHRDGGGRLLVRRDTDRDPRQLAAVLFGVAIVAALTGALVGFLIDFLLKEGQGMGAAGYRDHIVVCGWNSTARELIAELSTDEYTTKIVVVAEGDKNPAGDGVYFINGDITTANDLVRAGIEDAMAAVVCPADGSNEADMKSILCVMAIESLAPQVRTVVEVNNPAHVEHFQRADADEILVSSQLVSRLMARTSLYPGLAGLVTDIVSGGEGSELYRVSLPDEYVGLSVDELSAHLRAEHRATLLSVSRDGVGTSTRPTTSGCSPATTWSWSPSRWAPWRRWSPTTTTRTRPSSSDRGVYRIPASTAVWPLNVPVRVCAAAISVPTTRAITSSSPSAVTTVVDPSSRQATSSTTGTAVPAVPLPTTVADGSRVVIAPSTSIVSSACRPPVRMVAATVATQTGSPQASYTQRGPSTECSDVPTRCASPPASGAPR